MVTNPIYEGQSLYETIDPRFRPISFTSSTSLPPPTPTSTRLILESPYSNPQHQSHPLSFPPPVVEDGYTVMASAGGLGKTISDSGESNLDREPSEMARYVPEPSMLMSEC